MKLAERLNKEQAKAIKAIISSLDKNDQALLQMATGTGKTNVAVKVFEALKKKKANVRVLWLTHLQELVEQSKERFQNNIHGVDVSLFYGKDKDTEGQVVVASIPTISRPNNLKKFNPKDFDYIFVDEAHHTPANTWVKTLEYFKGKKFGFTATPNRPDGRTEHIQNIFGEQIFELSYKDAVKKKLVAEAEGYQILTNSVIVPKFDSNGDYTRSSLDRLWSTKDRQDIIVKSYLKYGRPSMKKMKLKYKTICYCINTEHARNMMEKFNKEGIKSGLLVGDGKVLTQSQRETVFNDFRKGDVEILCVVNILNEGVDIPEVGCLLMARPTKSNIIYWQQLGRGVRYIEGKKDKVVVLDFVDNTEHKYLGYLSTNTNPEGGVIHNRIRTEFLTEKDPIVIEKRVLDITASVEEFENQFRQVPIKRITEKNLKLMIKTGKIDKRIYG